MSTPFRLRLRVRYGECDAQQVVFNARYGDYIDIAATEFYRALFGSYQALIERGLDSQVVRQLIEWQGPARFDEVLLIGVQCQSLGTTSFTLHFEIRAENDLRPVARAETTYVMVDAATFQKTPIPEDIREFFERGAPEVLIDQAG